MLKHYEHDWQYLYFAIKDSTIHTRQKPSTGVTSYYHKNSLQSDSIQISIYQIYQQRDHAAKYITKFLAIHTV